jgi:pyruvate formate lyase activating enzyme
MRCKFCSNPDTWHREEGRRVSSKEIAAELARLLPYLRAQRGGITCSGGEPLLQPSFVAALFQEAHHLGLTTCLDTTGQGTKHHNWDAVLPHTDAVLLCIKHMDPARYTDICGLGQAGVLRFVAEVGARGIPLWARYVLVPGLTDDEAGIDLFVAFMSRQPTLQAVELLPYHLLGRQKWAELGLPYPLEGVAPPSREAVQAVISRMEAAGLKVQCEVRAK